jgi:hypothetical protein
MDTFRGEDKKRSKKEKKHRKDKKDKKDKKLKKEAKSKRRKKENDNSNDRRVKSKFPDPTDSSTEPLFAFQKRKCDAALLQMLSSPGIPLSEIAVEAPNNDISQPKKRSLAPMTKV